MKVGAADPFEVEGREWAGGNAAFRAARSDSVAKVAAFEDGEVVQDLVDPEVAGGLTPRERVMPVVVAILLVGIQAAFGSAESWIHPKHGGLVGKRRLPAW